MKGYFRQTDGQTSTCVWIKYSHHINIQFSKEIFVSWPSSVLFCTKSLFPPIYDLFENYQVHFGAQGKCPIHVSIYKISEAVSQRTILQTGNFPYLCLYIAGLSSRTSLYRRNLHDIHSYNWHMMRVWVQSKVRGYIFLELYTTVFITNCHN